MRIQCFLIYPTDPQNLRGMWHNPQTGETRSSRHDFGPGAMWRAPYYDTQPETIPLPLWVMLPNGAGPWCVEEHASGTGNKWTVVGEPPNITVTPSIDAIGYWHGFITNGEPVDAT